MKHEKTLGATVEKYSIWNKNLHIWFVDVRILHIHTHSQLGVAVRLYRTSHVKVQWTHSNTPVKSVITTAVHIGPNLGHVLSISFNRHFHIWCNLSADLWPIARPRAENVFFTNQFHFKYAEKIARSLLAYKKWGSKSSFDNMHSA